MGPALRDRVNLDFVTSLNGNNGSESVLSLLNITGGYHVLSKIIRRY